MSADDRCLLYLVTPPAFEIDVFAEELEAALAAGPVGAVQLRLKDTDDDAIRDAALHLKRVCHGHGVMLIMNDRPDLAAETGCDGVHVGQSDAGYREARRLVGDDRIVGVTCHASRHLAMVAAEDGADYVAFGAFYPTDTKEVEHHADPEILEWWHQMMVVPCVAIGGITVDNCAPLVAAGADFLAVVSGVWQHPDGPAAAVRRFNEIIDRHAGGEAVA